MQLYNTQLVNIGSQYSYSSSDQSEFLVIVSRLVDERPETDSHTTVKERVNLTHSLLNPLFMSPSHSHLKIKAQEYKHIIYLYSKYNLNMYQIHIAMKLQ